MPSARWITLTSLIRFVGEDVRASWRAWSWPVQIGVAWSFLWGAGLATSPWLGTRIIGGGFAFLAHTPHAHVLVGWYLIALTVAAFRWPHAGALCSTAVIALLRLIDSAWDPINLYGVIFWLLIIDGVRRTPYAER